LRVFSDRCPFQILRSMADLLLSNRRPFQSQDLYVLLPCHMSGRRLETGRQSESIIYMYNLSDLRKVDGFLWVLVT
jgi:hypothetical protein